MFPDAFAAVALDELVAEAALLTRVDRKYLVPAAEAAVILRELDPASRVLEIDQRRDFAYDSVYFDTPDRLSYRLTAQRRRRRFKLRTRSYLDTGGSFLEVKTKSGRGSTVKCRMPYEFVDRARLTGEGARYGARILGQDGHDPALVSQLRPSLVSRYHRSTLLLPCGSRATVDTRLWWADPGAAVGSGSAGEHNRNGHAAVVAATTVGEAEPAEFALDSHVIIESKSAGKPSELDRRLWRAGHRPTGISKFGTGTAALHAELPSNKWARTLRGPFARAGVPHGVAAANHMESARNMAISP